MTTLGIVQTVLITAGGVCLTILSFRLTVSDYQKFLALRHPAPSRAARHS